MQRQAPLFSYMYLQRAKALLPLHCGRNLSAHPSSACRLPVPFKKD